MRLQPFVSIIIPTRDRPRQLGACLRALAAQEYARDRFEVIVVDDGSRRPLDNVVEPWRGELGLMLLRQNSAGPGRARNSGAARARGEFLVFTDDDCAPAPDWLDRMARRFAAAPDRAVGGRILNALSANPYATTSQFIIDWVYEYFNTEFDRAIFFCSNNFGVPADRFSDIGGFTARWSLAAAEDREFCDRWLRQGHCMSYAPEAIVRHAHHLTPRSFWRQHFNYGRGACLFHQALIRRNADAPQPERAFYIGLLRYPFLRMPRHRALRIAALILVAQAATFSGYFRQRRSCL